MPKLFSDKSWPSNHAVKVNLPKGEKPTDEYSAILDEIEKGGWNSERGEKECATLDTDDEKDACRAKYVIRAKTLVASINCNGLHGAPHVMNVGVKPATDGGNEDIEHVWVKNLENKTICAKKFAKGEKPEFTFVVPEGTKMMWTFTVCRNNGLWRSETYAAMTHPMYPKEYKWKPMNFNGKKNPVKEVPPMPEFDPNAEHNAGDYEKVMKTAPEGWNEPDERWGQDN